MIMSFVSQTPLITLDSVSLKGDIMANHAHEKFEYMISYYENSI